MYGWSPSGWDAGIGPKGAVQCHLPLLCAALTHPRPTGSDMISCTVCQDPERLVLLQWLFTSCEACVWRPSQGGLRGMGLDLHSWDSLPWPGIQIHPTDVCASYWEPPAGCFYMLSSLQSLSGGEAATVPKANFQEAGDIVGIPRCLACSLEIGPVGILREPVAVARLVGCQDGSQLSSAPIVGVH